MNNRLQFLDFFAHRLDGLLARLSGVPETKFKFGVVAQQTPQQV